MIHNLNIPDFYNKPTTNDIVNKNFFFSIENEKVILKSEDGFIVHTKTNFNVDLVRQQLENKYWLLMVHYDIEFIDNWFGIDYIEKICYVG